MPVQWSNSVDWNLKICKRKFWFQYIFANPRAAWGSQQREAYILSNARSLEAWRGSLVHHVIEKFVVPDLKRGKIPKRAFEY